ncbi:MAG: hypothetical protein Q9187_005331 [Circinaria calcarea]
MPDESLRQSPHSPPEDARFNPSVILTDGATSSNFGIESQGMESVDMTAEERHALYMKVFARTLQDDGLRSPEYYRDKSQCISFQENASPVEVALYKAQILRRGYIEPEKLIERLEKLKPSDNFTLRKYPHRVMYWDKSPIPESPDLVKPPEADWFSDQWYDISRLRRQLGEHVVVNYTRKAYDYWKKICDIDLTPLPDLHLLKHINHSASGTLFPRYLVKGLHELREHADLKGDRYYEEEYQKVKVKRSDVIQNWQDENPGSILADNPLSIYRTWPAELMAQLNILDQEAMRCGSRRYMAELLETEKEMQKLVSFWRECRLITGIRTPPSPQWPDPKAKVRGLCWPDYLSERLEAIRKEFGISTNESLKRQLIEFARWKEAVLNTDSDPATSEIPLSNSLLNELDTAWQGYETIFDREDVEDEMIAKINQWRKSKRANTSSGRPHPSQLDSEISTEEMKNKTGPDAPHQQSSSQEGGEIAANQESMTQVVAQSPSTAAAKIYKNIRGLSRSDSIALQEATHSLQARPQKGRRPRGLRPMLTADKTTWSGRLRPKPGPKSASCQQVNAQRNPAERPQGVVKHGRRKSSKKPQQLLPKSTITESIMLEPSSSRTFSPQHLVNRGSLQTMPGSTKMTGVRKAQSSSDRARLGQPQRVRKLRKPECKPSISHASRQDKRADELLHFLTPPESQ